MTQTQRAIWHTQKSTLMSRIHPVLEAYKKASNHNKDAGIYVRNADSWIIEYCTQMIERKRLYAFLIKVASEFIVNTRTAQSQHMHGTVKEHLQSPLGPKRQYQ